MSHILFMYPVSNMDMTQDVMDVTANEYPMGILLAWEGEGKPTGAMSSPSGPWERANTEKTSILSEQQESASPMNRGIQCFNKQMKS